MQVVKQTVMTNVYGVTFIGGRDQILRQLRVCEIIPIPTHLPFLVYPLFIAFINECSKYIIKIYIGSYTM
jgi:hypothetical protein